MRDEQEVASCQLPVASLAGTALGPRVAPPDAAAVLRLLGAYLATALGREELEGLQFHRERPVLEGLHEELRQAQLWLTRRGAFGFGGLDDPRALLGAASAPGAALEGSELVLIRGFLESASGLRAHACAGEDTELWPRIGALARPIQDFITLRRRLGEALLPNGDLSDDASPELARLRRARVRQRQVIEQALEREMRRLSGEGVLRDEVVTQRGERFVLPVKSEQRRRAAGVVHGASSTGQTVFVEPLETVELNNEHIRLREQEQAEIHRILAELTGLVMAAAGAIGTAAACCGRLELVTAKARFATEYGGVPAEFSDGTEWELKEARHPLLEATLRARLEPRRPVVPLSLTLGPQRVLIISGPNTGGKTVALKTVAMSAWMAQCGLPVCARRARQPIMDAIYADVGDVQSIEQSLSTFSSHLVNLREILEAAAAESLVVLDELGTATNAAEGAALAVEIAETLLRRRAWTLITTHHDALKAWAGMHPAEVVNGSVGLDAETFAPTYVFRQGVPGVSAGLAMAERLGLPRRLVEAARQRLSQGEREAAGYLERLQQNLAAAEEQLAALRERETSLEAREKVVAAHDRGYLEKQVSQLRAEYDRRFQSFSARVEAQWHKALEELSGELTAAQRRKIGLTAKRLQRESAEAFGAEVAERTAAVPAAAAVARAGDRVRLRNASQPARVVRRLSDGSYEVEAGRIRMQIPADGVIAVLEAAPKAATGEVVERVAVAEINLIGERMEAAVARLDKFLDQAILNETAQVRVVHGAGFGVLRKAVGEALKAHPQVARHYHPPQNEGGQGVTIAEMK